MKSDCERAASFIDSLTRERQLAFVSRLMFELTLAGRTGYSMGSNEVDHPRLLREINELQHRLSAQVLKMVSDGLHLLPSSYLVELFLERDVEESISREIKCSFMDAISASLSK